MHILLSKFKKEFSWYYYCFEVKVPTTSFYINSKKRVALEVKKGCCKFNYSTEEFELNQEKTDPYFFSETNLETQKIYFKLLSYKRKNLELPDHIEIATG